MRSGVAAAARAIRAAEVAIAMAGMVAVVGAVMWGVLTRYVSHVPAAWTDEVASIGFAWSCLVGAALLYGSGGHPRMYEAQDIRSPAIRLAIFPLSATAQLVVLALLGFFAAQQAWINLDNPTSILRLPVSVFYVPLAWFGLSAAARLLARRAEWI